MQALTINLGRVGPSRLPGWSPRDDDVNEWLSTLTDKAEREVSGIYTVYLHFIERTFYAGVHRLPFMLNVGVEHHATMRVI